MGTSIILGALVLFILIGAGILVKHFKLVKHYKNISDYKRDNTSRRR